MTLYIDRRFQELEVQKPGKGFVMTIYRRRAASSPWALRKSLERRATGLRAVIAQRAYDDTVFDLDDAQEFEDLLNVKLTSAFPDSPEEARSELAEVEELLTRLDGWSVLENASRSAQLIAARLRLIEELGRTLICFEPDTDDLNGKFHRLASGRTATAERLQMVYARLAGYPEWDEFHLADLGDYRAALTPAQVKSRLTGRELDAALADPRWTKMD